MRLTEKSRWRYSKDHASLKNLKTIREREEWLQVIEDIILENHLEYIELGCAPGQYSAALCQNNNWKISGIDYSEDADLFLETMNLINREATLYRIDMFEEKVSRKFDVVASYGLVEHFRGKTLDDLFQLHNLYVKSGGYVVIEMPNFTGFQYFWHYLFDRPDLDNHNVDIMQPNSLNWFEKNGFKVLYNDYVGVMRLWGNSSFKNKYSKKFIIAFSLILNSVASLLDKIGIKFRGRTWSPSLIMIAKKY